MIFTIIPIYWGSLYKVPARNLDGWLVDFDGGLVGQAVSQAVLANSGNSKVTWHVRAPEDFVGESEEVARRVREQETWAAITITSGTTARLQAALASPDASYDGSRMIMAYGVEARSENAYRSLIRPSIDGLLTPITHQLAIRVTSQAASMPVDLNDMAQVSPQTLTIPVGYTLDNLIPFDQPVATASTFVGMLYTLIMGFFMVMIALAAREASGLGRRLSTCNLVVLRLSGCFVAYFFISLFYSLINLAFGLDVTRKYGHSGFMVFWMMSYLGLLATCLALESMITLLTQKGVPFFMLLWIITNLSVSIFPIEVLPGIFRYGYAFPFYNLSKALRTIVFGTKDEMGQVVGILLGWVILSCITLTAFEYLNAWRVAKASAAEAESGDIDAEQQVSVVSAQTLRGSGREEAEKK